jgi:hypothetical protein
VTVGVGVAGVGHVNQRTDACCLRRRRRERSKCLHQVFHI